MKITKLKYAYLDKQVKVMIMKIYTFSLYLQWWYSTEFTWHLSWCVPITIHGGFNAASFVYSHRQWIVSNQNLNLPDIVQSIPSQKNDKLGNNIIQYYRLY